MFFIYLLVFVGVCWCSLVFIGVHWCLLVFIVVSWCLLVFIGVYWCFIIYVHSYILVCFFVFIHVDFCFFVFFQVRSSLSMFILAQSYSIIYVQIILNQKCYLQPVNKIVSLGPFKEPKQLLFSFFKCVYHQRHLLIPPRLSPK